MSDAAPAPAPTATPADAGQAPDAPALEVRNSAPDARPESPVTWDEAAGKWVAKTKVDGKESVVPWEELHRDAQLARSAQERFERAKEIARKNDELTRRALAYQEALRNPQRAFEMWQQLGLDPHAQLEQMYAHAEAEAKLTPEQRELRAYREQQAKLVEQQRAEQERQQLEAEEAEQRATDERYERAFAKHMSALGVPEDPILRGHLSHILWAMHDRATAEGTGMPIGEAVSEAVGSMKSMMRSIAGTMKPDELAAALGPEVIDRIVQMRVAGAARIPEAVPTGRELPRASDGRFLPFTPFRAGTNVFGRLDR